MECKLDNITVHYETMGEGKPIVMLHGLPSDHRHMVSDMEPLFKQRTGWKRIYPDLPGMGKTPGADWITTQDQMLDVLLDFIDEVIPGQRFALAGTSYGGYLARGVVYRRRESMDGLLLNVPGAGTDDGKPYLPRPLVIHEDAEFLAALAPDEQDLREFFVVQSMDLLADFRRVISPAVAIADHAFLQRLDQQYAFSFDVDTLPTPFPAPALFLTGRQDSWCGYRETYQLLDNYPRASFVVLDRAGHALAGEQKMLFSVLVNEWLDRVEEFIGSNG